MEKDRKQYGRECEIKDKRENDFIESEKIQTVNRSVSDPSSHTRDVNSRRIFKNAKLTCQFLKDYSGISIFQNIEPEDIEDVTSKYQAYLGVEFEADTVKKIHIRTEEKEQEIYVLPLIEHKSYVDYNIQMQILRYMSVIWYDYGKQKNAEAGKDLTSRKSFRYPLIIPIIYYEGKANWTADTELWRRIDLGNELKEYVPDFTYKVIRVNDYTNEEIRQNADEMSLVMMFNKIQSSKDYEEFLRTSKAFMDEVLQDTPQELLHVLLDVFWALLMKMNVPQEEAEELMNQMEARNMGYLFENAEKMDIQAERRNTQEARKKAEEAERRADEAERKADEAERKADEAERKADEAERKADEAERKADEAEQKADEAERKVDEAERKADAAKKEADAKIKRMETSFREFLKTLVELCKKENLTKEETKACLLDRYKINETDLAVYFEDIWNHFN